MAAILARLRGFEPPTYRLGGGRSILLSYRRIESGHFPLRYRTIVTQLSLSVNGGGEN